MRRCTAARSPKDRAILTFVEDVGRQQRRGRHQPLDVARGHPRPRKIFYTTGRLTSEMVIKAAQMQIPVLVSRSGSTKMGHEVASQVGITMIGRAVGKHYLLFSPAGIACSRQRGRSRGDGGGPRAAGQRLPRRAAPVCPLPASLGHG